MNIHKIKQALEQEGTTPSIPATTPEGVYHTVSKRVDYIANELCDVLDDLMFCIDDMRDVQYSITSDSFCRMLSRKSKDIREEVLQDLVYWTKELTYYDLSNCCGRLKDTVEEVYHG